MTLTKVSPVSTRNSPHTSVAQSSAVTTQLELSSLLAFHPYAEIRTLQVEETTTCITLMGRVSRLLAHPGSAYFSPSDQVEGHAVS
jgi:hypothetical protein